MTKKTIGFVSDLHVGNQCSIMPPVVVEGVFGGREEHEQNDLQKMLYGYWKKTVKFLGKLDTLVVLGDLVDGVNEKADGLGTWTTNVNIQALGASELLSKIKCKKGIVVGGSRYHIKKNPCGDELAALYRKFTFVPQDFILNVPRKGTPFRMHLRHESRESSTFYPFTSLWNEMEMLRQKQKQWGWVDGIARGHVHNYKFAEEGDAFAFTVPAWKMRDEYATKNVRWTPSIGGIKLTVFDDDYSIERIKWEPKVNVMEIKV